MWSWIYRLRYNYAKYRPTSDGVHSIVKEKHKKDVRLLDGDVTVYGIFREKKGNIAQIVKFDESTSAKCWKLE